MAKTIEILNDFKVKGLKCPPDKKLIQVPDGDGLYLRLYKEGNMNWLLRFSLNGKPSNMGLGAYPDVSIQQARLQKDTNKKLAKQGIDPRIERDKIKLSNQSGKNMIFSDAFEMLKDEFTKRGKWLPRTLERNQGIYDNYLKHTLGKFPLKDIDEDMLYQVIEGIYNKAPNTSSKARYIISNIYKVAKSKRKYKGLNPARDLEGDPLLTPPAPKHHKDVDMDRVGELFGKLKHTGHLESTKLAVFITFVTALRTNSVRNIRWNWIKKYKGLDYLEIPAQFESVNVMKNKLPFRCPLPKQAMRLLNEIKDVRNPKPNDFIFKGEKSNKPISENVICLCVQNILGGKEYGTAHGIRTTFNRAVSKANRFEVEKIESQFTHAFPITSIRKTYLGNEDYLEERVEIVQWFTDWIDEQVRAFK